MTYQKFVLIT